MHHAAQVIKTWCKHGNLARSAPQCRIQPTQGENQDNVNHGNKGMTNEISLIQPALKITGEMRVGDEGGRSIVVY